MNRVIEPKTTPKGYLMGAQADMPDIRDWPYEPTLATLKRRMDPPGGLTILDQGNEGACTGFGLTAVINLLNRKRNSTVQVSPRMLYEMAKRHDEWPGEQYSGSSCRGAIKGWYNMGVCTSDQWKYLPGQPGDLTVERAKAARENTIGAYYRLQPRVSDFHAALNETGAIYCSARTHSGWFSPNKQTGVITFEKEQQGGHAFALVGYNSKGFWIQNSWADSWGKKGLALWLYEDWLENLMDGWVLSLALPTPQIWHLPDKTDRNRSGFSLTAAPPRSEIAGHFVHLDDGSFHTSGRYWSGINDVQITAANLAKSSDYDHLLLYAHGGLNSPTASAKRIAAMKGTFKKNRIYPYHFMYDTGILEEILDVILRREEDVDDRVAFFTDLTDILIETVTRVPCRALWREMKRGAKKPFLPDRDGSRSLQAFIGELTKQDARKLKIHLAGHSTGGILMAWLLKALEDKGISIRVASCSLLAPACTIDLFYSNYLPYLQARPDSFGIDRMTVYNLKDELEQDDQVGGVYRKSLLYLVSRAFEEEPPEKILGMEEYSDNLKYSATIRDLGTKLVFQYSDGQSPDYTTSTTHGGFDNDPATMNAMLKTILGRVPDHPFTKESLSY